ncbi:MAG: hypothetical protein JWO53_913 [Chlamydiia bacterium]|nr:hypothetical protein [Chlamydiia bacterium]
MDNLITLYQERLHLQIATCVRIEHEDALVAIVYRVEQIDGQQFILKICPRASDYLREIYFLKYLAGIVPVPCIIEVVQPEEGVAGAILMECLPGALLKTTEFTGKLAYEIGAVLACIHMNRFSDYGDLVQGELSADPRAYFTFKFEEGMDECSAHLPQQLIKKCRHYYDTHMSFLNSVDGPCIVHRDFRPGNLIVHDGKLQGVIDWAGARASFAEEDFCSLEHGEWSDNANSKKSFLEGYASIRPVPAYKELITLLRLSKAVATIGFTVKKGTWENSSARLYEFNRHFLETFSEV